MKAQTLLEKKMFHSEEGFGRDVPNVLEKRKITTIIWSLYLMQYWDSGVEKNTTQDLKALIPMNISMLTLV